MIIDSHTHIGFGGAITASVDDLLKSMAEAKIEKALVFSGRLNNCLNDKLIKTIAPHRDKLHGVGYGTSGMSLEQLLFIEENIRNKTIVGLKFYPGYEYFYPNDESIKDVLYLCENYGIPAIFHTGDCYTKAGVAKLKYAHPLAVDDLAADHQKLKIVMAHVGNPWITDAAAVCYNKKNVWGDCSGFICGDSLSEKQIKDFSQKMHYFLDYVEDPTKLIFGSDWPICGQASYLAAVEETVNFDDALWTRLTQTNAQELFNI